MGLVEDLKSHRSTSNDPPKSDYTLLKKKTGSGITHIGGISAKLLPKVPGDGGTHASQQQKVCRESNSQY